ncbi:hypothetical protein L2E82_14311 [Cichorium intybus]|uniref:Uncharacterized protein n=1 Tax=Cichorium intybus TaxID=13427 RepID=A0ACB9EZ37_CICIN|nr:hypothetical protein L2E82_14311 [Cichorium intybus]
MTKKPRVPGVLWKLFQNRARTLAETILSLIPPQQSSATVQCRCSRHCLHCCCDGDRMSFLLREDDPSDYRNSFKHHIRSSYITFMEPSIKEDRRWPHDLFTEIFFNIYSPESKETPSENRILDVTESRKRSRSYAWQRRHKRRKLSNQITSDSNSSLHEVKMKVPCSCCSIWNSLEKIPTQVQINIINSLKPNVAGANALFKEIFGSTLQSTVCSHSNDICLIGTTCLYHSLHKLLKILIRKAINCPRLKILKKHIFMPSSDQKDLHCSKGQVVSFIWAASRSIGKKRTARKDELLFNLQQHVKYNVLKIDKDFYLQNVGIPQGSILSSLLCSFYYGHMENSKIVPFVNKVTEMGSGGGYFGQNLLMRFIDDFLFISTSKKQALAFLSRLERGFYEYNCDMNKEKFGLSFDDDKIRVSSNRVYFDENGNKFLKWSGLFINCNTLEVQADYTRFMYKLMKKRMFSVVSDDSLRPILKVKRKEVEWLGLRGYFEVLKRKEGRYKEVLSLLEMKLKSLNEVERVSHALKFAVDKSNSSILWKIKY